MLKSLARYGDNIKLLMRSCLQYGSHASSIFRESFNCTLMDFTSQLQDEALMSHLQVQTSTEAACTSEKLHSYLTETS